MIIMENHEQYLHMNDDLFEKSETIHDQSQTTHDEEIQTTHDHDEDDD